VRSFGAMRQDLAALRAWLLEKGVTHVGMEGTGVYWQPVYAALEGDVTVTVIVGNASHMRNVPLRPPCGRLLRNRIAGGDDARRT